MPPPSLPPSPPSLHLPVEIFCSYAHADEPYRQQLETHIALLKRQGLVSLWHDGQLLPGSNWSDTINQHLEQASIIILLISAHFINSDYCYNIEMQRALERSAANAAHLIPIILSPCEWQRTPIASLHILPTAGKPITKWPDPASAWHDVATGIRRVIEALPTFPTLPTLPHLTPNAPHATLPPTWMIPYRPNPFFIGRDELLTQLHQQLQPGQPMALSQPQAVSGLGGIGKTQLAVAYAYRYAQHYQVVLWAYAESIETLNSSYNQIATTLNLATPETQKQEILIQAVKTWLQNHRDWLLILDNADELTLLNAFLPPAPGGHILITTRARTTGTIARRVEVQTFTQELGAIFLLRRASLLAPDAPLSQASPQDQQLAQSISHELGGLPLALDQAGAYLEQTHLGLRDYQSIYQQQRKHLLSERGKSVLDHPEPVATTWSLSFARVEQKSVIAANILRLSAFLAPDAIPLTIITAGTDPLAKDLLTLGEALEILHAYSLLSHDPTTGTLSLHRLVQAVISDSMTVKKASAWKQRAVQSVNAATPDVADVSQWTVCEQWLPHALICATWIEQAHLTKPTSALLLNEAGYYLNQRAHYREAEPLLVRALAIREQEQGPQHPDTASSLNNLALLYRDQGKYAEAEPLYMRALAISEQELGPQHPDTASSLNNLALLYHDQGKYAEAEPLYMRALAISEQELGPQHPDTASSLNNLANLYRDQGKYTEAEPLYTRALAITERVLGREHPSTLLVHRNYASLLKAMGRNEEE